MKQYVISNKLGLGTNALSSYYEKFLATGEVKCIDGEIPIEIPDGWEWCRLGNLCTIYGRIGYRGYTKAYIVEKGDGAISISPSNMKENGLMSFDIATYISWFKYEESPEIQIEIGDILVVKTGSSFGKTCIIKDLPEKATINPQIAVLKFVSIHQDWLVFALNSPFVQNQFSEYVIGTSIPTFSQEKLSSTLLPLPPFEEQQHIVDKIVEIMPIVDKYNNAQNELDKLNTFNKEQLKKSILQEAIQGKLVPQIAEEGTSQDLLEQIRQEKQKLAKEGKLKKSALNDSNIFKGDDNKYWEKVGKEVRSIDDEIPFEIPKTWIWVRLNDICSYIQRGKSPKYSLIKKYPVIAQKCNQWSGFSIDKAQFIEPSTLMSYGVERLLQDGDLMWNSTGLGTLGRMAIYWNSLNPYGVAVADSHVTVIRALKQFVQPKYLYYYFSSNTVQSVIEDKADGSTKQKELSTATIKSYILPLPPLSEQQRIVAKIEELASIMSR